MTAANLNVLFLGDISRAEFRPSFERFGSAMLCRDVAEIEGHLAAGSPPPELVIVCESWPDEFPAGHVSRLLAALPLARIVCVSGFWCESAGRTRSHWPPALRVPVWDAWARIERELEVVAGERAALPFTATRDECLLDTNSSVPPPPIAGESASVRGTVRVELYDPALSAELSARLQQQGWTEIIDPKAVVDTVFVQAEPSSTEACTAIAERCRAVSPAVVYAVTTWPLPEWTEQLRAAGVQRVINPLLLDTERESSSGPELCA